MVLMTGATGLIGSAVLRRLIAAGWAVRCLVRDPRRLGAERVRVQIALGDLGDPASFRHALRGVDTVVHLGASIRDQPSGSIEELAGLATWRLLRAAERAGAERFVFFSALGASTHGAARLVRAKALAERTVAASPVPATVFALSLVYAPGDAWLRLLERLALLPAMPLPGDGTALFQPIWAEDVADCVMAALEQEPSPALTARYELAGPQTLSHAAIVELALRSFGRPRPLARLPRRVVRRGLTVAETLLGPAAFATWDEAELLGASMTTSRGTADAQALGVAPRAMGAVLGVD